MMVEKKSSFYSFKIYNIFLRYFINTTKTLFQSVMAFNIHCIIQHIHFAYIMLEMETNLNT